MLPSQNYWIENKKRTSKCSIFKAKIDVPIFRYFIPWPSPKATALKTEGQIVKADFHQFLICNHTAYAFKHHGTYNSKEVRRDNSSSRKLNHMAVRNEEHRKATHKENSIHKSSSTLLVKVKVKVFILKGTWCISRVIMKWLSHVISIDLGFLSLLGGHEIKSSKSNWTQHHEQLPQWRQQQTRVHS